MRLSTTPFESSSRDLSEFNGFETFGPQNNIFGEKYVANVDFSRRSQLDSRDKLAGQPGWPASRLAGQPTGWLASWPAQHPTHKKCARGSQVHRQGFLCDPPALRNIETLAMDKKKLHRCFELTGILKREISTVEILDFNCWSVSISKF